MDYGKYHDIIEHAQPVLNDYDFAHTCRVFNYSLQIMCAILHDIGCADNLAGKAAACVLTRSNNWGIPQQMMETKILFCADKPGTAGIVGAARAAKAGRAAIFMPRHWPDTYAGGLHC